MNIAKLNTASLDDKTFIIKRGTSGGGTPINNQDKVVDITENGTTEVVADGGYTGLGKVTINTEVSGGESGSNIEYLDVSGEFTLLDILGTGFVEVKISVENAPIPIEVFISGGIYAYAMISDFRQMGATVNFVAAAFDRDLITSMKQNGVVTTQTAYETLVSKGESYVEAYNNLPRITKEQFYDLTT